ncbi:Gfo/Idh/MocA family oxidoreductase [Nonomuraea sp. MG754425]|nr:Gfo/Idh/MocA family oxidoreductase [Nonomuraea sp. MG754425]
MRIGFVGCGYVADLYAATLPNHPELELIGVFDRAENRRRAFSAHYGVPEYPSLAAMLEDPSLDIVVNLVNPAHHFPVSQAALLAGKHVYVEKPLATELAQARHLVELAAERGLGLASAPASVLGEPAQTAWQALRAGAVGTPLLAYAELDDGYVLGEHYHEWVSASGAPWPYMDEFRTGCTIEHAAYALDWLTTFFGPVTELTAFAASLAPNPHFAAMGETPAPDFSVACLRFGPSETAVDGLVARVTNSIVAPRRHSLQIIGDEGVLIVQSVWDYASPVVVRRGQSGYPEIYPPVRPGPSALSRVGANNMDFARGVAELSAELRGRRRSRLGVDRALHVLEVTLEIARANKGAISRPTTTFTPPKPMSWAAGEPPRPWAETASTR